MARKTISQQMDMMDEVDRYEREKFERDAYYIREKLKTHYVNAYEQYGYTGDQIPDGLVVIMCMNGRTMKSEAYLTRWFRCVTGFHRTVSGNALHLISAPNNEWPDEPVWQAYHGCRWDYPGGELWTRKEPEFEPEIGFGDCGDCYKDCEKCQVKTGPYPRCRRNV